MKVLILDLHCLNAIADDYETIASIVDPTTSTYVRLAPLPERLDAVWFRLNDSGRRQLDASWVDE